MSVKLKFCGIRRNEDVDFANETRPDYIGFIFYEKSKRFISPELAKQLKARLDKGIKTVGVFVNMPAERLAEFSAAADIFQLHGDESKEYADKVRSMFPEKEIWKAVRLRSFSDIERAAETNADKYVLDAFSEDYGGTGKRIDKELLNEAVKRLDKPVFIAGGIGADNICETIRSFMPFGIDLSSSIETDGFKDLSKMMNITEILREENLR